MLKMKVIEVREYPRQATADVTLEYGPARKKLVLEMVPATQFQLGQALVLVVAAPETAAAEPEPEKAGKKKGSRRGDEDDA